MRTVTSPVAGPWSSGDAIGATPLVSALFWHESTIDVMNRMGVDIATLGNHEFDAGVTELQRVMGGGCREPKAGDPAVSCALGRHEGAKFPHISANIVQPDGRPLVPPSVIREYGGVKVGFIGAVTTDMPSLVVPSGIAGLRFIDEATAINAEAARLQAAGVQALVVVIHEGGNTGEAGSTMEWNDAGCAARRGAIFEIEKQLSPAVDVVLSGHSHQGYRCVINGRPVMQATAQGRGVSVLDLVLDAKTGDIDRTRSLHRNLPVFNEKTSAAHRELIIAQEPAPYAFGAERRPARRRGGRACGRLCRPCAPAGRAHRGPHCAATSPPAPTTATWPPAAWWPTRNGPPRARPNAVAASLR